MLGNMTTRSPPKLYTIAEAAEHFRVSRRVFQGYIAKWPFYRMLGQTKLFTDSDLDAL